MAVTSCVEIFGPRGSGTDGQFQNTYTRAFRVTTDTRYTGSRAVRLAPGIDIGNTYSIGVDGVDAWFEEDTGAACRSIRADEDGPDGLSWIVTVEYGPWEPREESPLDEP